MKVLKNKFFFLNLSLIEYEYYLKEKFWRFKLGIYWLFFIYINWEKFLYMRDLKDEIKVRVVRYNNKIDK